jgi:anti-sigma regulatory factor (Ser/Thr protein kinase)
MEGEAVPDLETVEPPDRPLEWSTSLPPEPTAVPLARHQLRALLSDWQLRCVLEDAELVTGELVGNVVRHGSFPAELRVEWYGRRVRVEVADASPEQPVERRRDPGEPGGFGLPIVDAVSEAWGVRPGPTGKVVWADLPLK